jgi:uroporphyrinogen-III decarboxylase
LIGDEAMMMIIMDPDLLHAVHLWITETYILLIDHFSKQAGFPISSIHVGECSGTMISNDQYLEFLTPYISRLGKAYGNVRLHSCGDSNHILEAISKIENLSIIDTASNTSVAKIRELLGVDFEINLEPPVQLMLKDSPADELLAWLNNTLKENQDGPIKFVLHLDKGYSVDNCLMIYDELINKRLIKKP